MERYINHSELHSFEIIFFLLLSLVDWNLFLHDNLLYLRSDHRNLLLFHYRFLLLGLKFSRFRRVLSSVPLVESASNSPLLLLDNLSDELAIAYLVYNHLLYLVFTRLPNVALVWIVKSIHLQPLLFFLLLELIETRVRSLSLLTFDILVCSCSDPKLLEPSA